MRETRKDLLSLLIFMFWSCVIGVFKHEAEEGQDVLLQWKSPRQQDLSLLRMDCTFKSNTKMIYVHQGNQQTESEDAQFSGRVECDRKALKQGQVLLRLRRLTALDSGEYHCYMEAGGMKGDSWGFTFYERFVISVSPSQTPAATTKPETQPGDAVTKQAENNDRNRMWILILIIPGAVFLALCIFVWAFILGTNSRGDGPAQEDPVEEIPAENVPGF